jgi:hypothetical protein
MAKELHLIPGTFYVPPATVIFLRQFNDRKKSGH